MAQMPRFSTYAKVFGLGAVLAVLAIGAYTQFGPSAPNEDTMAAPPAITVFKSPTCGCCSKWVAHLEEHGFQVNATDMPDVTPMKQRYDLPKSLASCHTAVVDGYVVEGHVPADDIKRLLQERPDVTGIAVPGMPIGSPGMEQGDRTQPYEVIAFSPEGQEVFARH